MSTDEFLKDMGVISSGKVTLKEPSKASDKQFEEQFRTVQVNPKLRENPKINQDLQSLATSNLNYKATGDLVTLGSKSATISPDKENQNQWNQPTVFSQASYKQEPMKSEHGSEMIGSHLKQSVEKVQVEQSQLLTPEEGEELSYYALSDARAVADIIQRENLITKY